MVINGFRYVAIGAYDEKYQSIDIHAVNNGLISTKDTKVTGYIIVDLTSSGTSGASKAMVMTPEETMNFVDTHENILGITVVHSSKDGRYIAKRWDKMENNLMACENRFELTMSQAFLNASREYNLAQMSSYNHYTNMHGSNSDQAKKNNQPSSSSVSIEDLINQINILKQQNNELYNQMMALTRRVDELSNQPQS